MKMRRSTSTFLNSDGMTNVSRDMSSIKLFCSGVPVSSTRRCACSCTNNNKKDEGCRMRALLE